MYQSRVYFGKFSATAVGRPSSGGILTLGVNGVDLIYLNVSRLKPTTIPVQREDFAGDEDAWCARLRQLAPRWWRSLEDRDRANNEADVQRFKTAVEKESVYVGWPSVGEGVWVFKCPTGYPPSGFAAYDMCLNMDERCEVLKKHGAQFHPDPRECPELTEQYEVRFRRERDHLEEVWGENLRQTCSLR